MKMAAKDLAGRALLALAGCLLGGAEAQLVDNVDFQWSDAELPFPLSDAMANYLHLPGRRTDDGSGPGLVVLTGGCDDPNGNVRVDGGGFDLFACLSTSKKTLGFDPYRERFEELEDMPRERQRHGAAVVDGELYVVGGRDSDDNLVATIDSYDPEDDTWRPRGSVPANLVTSDLTAWAWKDYIYVAGGFVQDYTAVGTVYRFKTSKRTTGLEFETLTPSPHPRGDFHAVLHSGYAYLAGGITHTSVWCEALTTVERYDMEADEWEDLPPLAVGRADMAVAVLGGKVLAVGGESKPDDCAELADPAYGSFPTDHVAVLLNADADDPNDAEWVDFEDFDDERFRFAAATVPGLGRVYAFGGQMPFDFTCDCFPTSAKVAYGVETFAALKGAEDDGTMRVGTIVGIAVAVAAAAIVMVVLAVTLRKSKKKQESLEVELKNEQAAKANQAATEG